jgi:hypothetical protein
VADEAVLNNVQEKTENSPLKKKIWFFFVLLRFFHFILLISDRFPLRFFLGQAIFQYIFISLRFFRFFSLISCLFSLKIFAVLLQSETSKIMLLFDSKRKNFFASISIFTSEAKTRAHPNLNLMLITSEDFILREWWLQCSGRK